MSATASTLAATPSLPAGAEHFDFFIGKWRTRHRRLKRRLAGDTEWLAFDGHCHVRKILGGLGNMDDNLINSPAGAYEAVTLRRFNPNDGLWSIWWVDARIPGIEPPMVGDFADGVGTFYAEDVQEGRPVRVRFLWTRLDTASPRWEQAFSTDGGASWEINWTTEFDRIG